MGSGDQGINPDRWTVIPRTLCFVTHGQDVLLIKNPDHKKVFPGRYNGVGGHLERGEDPATGARREILEETGLTVHQIRYRGTTHIDAGRAVGILLFIFTAVAESRAVVEGDEGTLHWVPLAAVDSLPLAEDLPILLPKLFGDHKNDLPFFAHVRYNDADQMVMTFAEDV